MSAMASQITGVLVIVLSAPAAGRIDRMVRRLGTDAKYQCDISFNSSYQHGSCCNHDDVIKWKPFLRCWPFVRGIHRSPVDSPHKGQWRGALMFCLICAWTDRWVNNGDAGDLRRHRANYDVTAMMRIELKIALCYIVDYDIIINVIGSMRSTIDILVLMIMTFLL